MQKYKVRIAKIDIESFQIIQSMKLIIKKHRYSKNAIIKICIAALYVLVRGTRTTMRFCIDSDFRAIFLLQLLNSKNVHQTTAYTCIDRYPAIFSACSSYLSGKKDLKILSFGCSTGEEVLTLRKYFPTAEIIGVDVNRVSLAKCRKLPIDDRISFLYSDIREIEKHGLYDVIFCMAVFQREPFKIVSERISSLKKIYPFEKFERKIIELDKMIKPQGLLVIHYTQYSIWDTAVASKYKALGLHNQDNYLSPLFDKNSNLVINPPSLNTVFIKQY